MPCHTSPTVTVCVQRSVPLARMAICGGTHGNELSGVCGGEGVWPIPVTTVLSNPRAVKECRRYIDRNMNRCFNRDTAGTGCPD
uniref:Succinylglutamate desuccinylase/Aspartoacylase catalytic domain-containing protein n=1 Tax=Sinocyclocheilus anshuiensis TaxID=1608454 RepID=A0A671KLD2_9TELE